jgi:hypothetical protein
LESFERAKQVLNLLAYELKDVSIDTQISIQHVVAGLIDDAVKEALRPYEKQIKKEQEQQSLLRVRRRSK